jgi:hypothetical protein
MDFLAAALTGFFAAGLERLTAIRFLTAFFFDAFGLFFFPDDFFVAVFFFFAIPIPPISSATPHLRRVDLHLA